MRYHAKLLAVFIGFGLIAFAMYTASASEPVRDGAGAIIIPAERTSAFVNATQTGWAQYLDTQYPCSGTPFSVAADTDTVLPNNAGSKIETQMPSDITAMYDGSVITGRNGDGLLITVDMSATPTNVGTTYVEVWFDIGGSVGVLYKRIISFPKGNGVERPINFTVAGYSLDTWEANGPTVYVRGNGTFDVCDIRYVLTRTHRAR